MSEKQFSKDNGWEISEFKDAHGSSDKDMTKHIREQWNNIFNMLTEKSFINLNFPTQKNFYLRVRVK